VKIYPPESLASGCRHPGGQPLVEALIVLLVGVAFAFGANWLSPRGLKLARNYFPAESNRLVTPAKNIGVPFGPAGTNQALPSSAALLASRLTEQGLQLLDGRQANQLFQDPGFKTGAIVFVDARDEIRYHEGHIPGAYEFDPYYPEKYFTNVLPACQTARRIVVYCNGGDCDDSESAALTLKDVGIPISRLFIYGGGITDWTTNGLPVEAGARNSGSLHGPNQ